MADEIKMERSGKAAVWRKHHDPVPVVNDIDWNRRYNECGDAGALAMIACASTAGTTILKLVVGEGDYLKWVATGDKRWKRIYFGEHGEANSLMWCPTDGRLLASGSDCGQLSIVEYQRDLQKFDFKTSFKVQVGDSISCVTWTQDGASLIVSTKPGLDLVFFKKQINGGVSTFSRVGKIRYPDTQAGTTIRLCLIPKFPNLIVSSSTESSKVRLWVRSKTDEIGWKQGLEFSTGRNVVAMSVAVDIVTTIHKGDRVNDWVVFTREGLHGIQYCLGDKGSFDCGHKDIKYKNSRTSKNSEANTICTMKFSSGVKWYHLSTGTNETMILYEGSYEGGLQYKLVHAHRDHVMVKGEAKCVKINPLFLDDHTMQAVVGGDGGFLHFWYMGKEKMQLDRFLERLDEEHYYESVVPEYTAHAIPPDDESDDGCHVKTGASQHDASSKMSGSSVEHGSSDNVSTEPTPTPARRGKKVDSDVSYSPGSSSILSDEAEGSGYGREGAMYQPDLHATLDNLVNVCEASSLKKMKSATKFLAEQEDVISKKKIDVQTQLNSLMNDMKVTLQSCVSHVEGMNQMQEVNELKVFTSDLVGRLKQIDEKCNADKTELSEEEKAFREEISSLCKLPMARKFLT